MKPVFKSTIHVFQNYLLKFHPLARAMDSRVKKRWVVNRSMVSNPRRYCYFRIPKCANSTIVRTLACYDPSIPYDVNDERGRSYKNKSSLIRAQALSVSSLCEKYYLFTFVRNPYSRVLSAYLDKITSTDKKNFAGKRSAIAALSKSGQEITFQAFVRYLEEGGLYADPHWTPQHALLPVETERINFVGKVEKLDEDLRFLVNHLFGAGTYQGAVMRQTGRTGSAGRIMQYYDRDLFNRVYQLYDQDFILFHYLKDWSVNAPVSS